MTFIHTALSWSLTAIAALLLTACNPIPAEPDKPAVVPTTTPEPERMQANPYDFGFAFAEIDSDGIDPALYADAILKIRACMEGEPSEGEGAGYTPGQTAAIQWVSVLAVMIFSSYEDFEQGDTNLCKSLIGLQESCLASQ